MTALLYEILILKLRKLVTRNVTNKEIQLNKDPTLVAKDALLHEIVALLHNLSCTQDEFLIKWNRKHALEFPVVALTGHDENEGFMIQLKVGTIIF